MYQSRHNSANQVKQDKSETADSYLYIICKNPQENHIPDKMHPSTMQKHAGYQSVKILSAPDFAWYSAVCVEKLLDLFRAELQLLPEYVTINYYKQVGKHRFRPASYIIITDWEKHILKIT